MEQSKDQGGQTLPPAGRAPRASTAFLHTIYDWFEPIQTKPPSAIGHRHRIAIRAGTRRDRTAAPSGRPRGGSCRPDPTLPDTASRERLGRPGRQAVRLNESRPPSAAAGGGTRPRNTRPLPDHLRRTAVAGSEGGWVARDPRADPSPPRLPRATREAVRGESPASRPRPGRGGLLHFARQDASRHRGRRAVAPRVAGPLPAPR